MKINSLMELVALRLHERAAITALGAGEDGGGRIVANVMRVPGGWLYSWETEETTFVPLPPAVAHVEGVDY